MMDAKAFWGFTKLGLLGILAMLVYAGYKILKKKLLNSRIGGLFK